MVLLKILRWKFEKNMFFFFKQERVILECLVKHSQGFLEIKLVSGELSQPQFVEDESFEFEWPKQTYIHASITLPTMISNFKGLAVLFLRFCIYFWNCRSQLNLWEPIWLILEYGTFWVPLTTQKIGGFSATRMDVSLPNWNRCK